jgi:hypothetical protein
MADRFMRVIASWGRDTGLPEDASVNVWHFAHRDYPVGTTPSDSANDIVDRLESFYQDIASIYSSENGTAVICKVYDLNDPEPRSVILERSIEVVPSPTEGFPHEVAICMSFAAAVASGQPRARRRGRVYLGPIYSGASSTSGGRVLVSATVRGIITAAAAAAFDTGLIATDPRLVVYSRTDDQTGESVANSCHDVVTLWVDDAWDTQRRRGTAPTTRDTIAITR